MLARAGFDIEVAPNLWRRRGMQNPGSQIKNYFSTHPSTTERAVAMTQTISEIKDKLSREEAILPKTLRGQSLAVNALARDPTPVNTTPVTVQLAPALVPVVQTMPAPAVVAVASRLTGTASRMFAQLYLIRGPVVSNPPQTFSGEFLDTGKASVVLSGRRRLTGDFELFGIDEKLAAKYSARLIKPDSVKPTLGNDAKGFAAFSDGIGAEIECSYFLNRSTGRGQGMCADNEKNTYRIVFD